MANNAINSDSRKRCSFVAPLFAAGYGERCIQKNTSSKYSTETAKASEQRRERTSVRSMSSTAQPIQFNTPSSNCQGVQRYRFECELDMHSSV